MVQPGHKLQVGELPQRRQRAVQLLAPRCMVERQELQARKPVKAGGQRTVPDSQGPAVAPDPRKCQAGKADSDAGVHGTVGTHEFTQRSPDGGATTV